MTYPEWVEALLRAHRASRGHGLRCTGCWACDVLPRVTDEDRERCKELSRGAPGTVRGGFDGHHVIPKQTLKRDVRWTHDILGEGPALLVTVDVRGDELGEGAVITQKEMTLAKVLVDVRVGVPLRRWHHDQLENRRLYIPRWIIPAGVEEVAVELGLGWWLDRTFGPIDGRS